MSKKEHLQRVLLPITLPWNVHCYFALLLGIYSFCADNDLIHVEFLIHVKFLYYKLTRAERILGLLAQTFPLWLYR
jgi:hypothetical protein